MESGWSLPGTLDHGRQGLPVCLCPLLAPGTCRSCIRSVHRVIWGGWHHCAFVPMAGALSLLAGTGKCWSGGCGLIPGKARSGASRAGAVHPLGTPARWATLSPDGLYLALFLQSRVSVFSKAPEGDWQLQCQWACRRGRVSWAIAEVHSVMVFQCPVAAPVFCRWPGIARFSPDRGALAGMRPGSGPCRGTCDLRQPLGPLLLRS